MLKIPFELGRMHFSVKVPDSARILRMGQAERPADPARAVRRALDRPIGSLPLGELIAGRLAQKPDARAVIVLSDNTRPVPYRGEEGILIPIVDALTDAGLAPDRITLLVATGTHHAMGDAALREFLDPRIFERGIPIVNHDCRDDQALVHVGRTRYGGEIRLNRRYVDADLKILTGLVESHFMAGTSGGRKSICPGLLAEDSIFGLHGAPILDHPRAADLVLDGNPVHEESLAVARMAGCDFIVNVTLDSAYRITGVFAGEMDRAHRAAVDHLKSYAALPADGIYDLVVTHAGFVGINHYQAAKGALACLPLAAPGGKIVLAASHPDLDPIGGPQYKSQMKLLGELGPETYVRTILAEDWSFVPEQWQAQMWAKLFRVIPPRDVIYCTREIAPSDFEWLPGRDARTLVPGAEGLAALTERAAAWAAVRLRERLGREPRIAVLPDGPYAVPIA